MTGFILVTELHRNYQNNFFTYSMTVRLKTAVLPMIADDQQYLISNTSGYAMDKSLVIIHALIICN